MGKSGFSFKSLFSTVLLLSIFLVVYGCGGSSSSKTSMNDSSNSTDRTARLSVSFKLPQGDVQSAVLSDVTTHILVNVTQWNTDSMHNLIKVNEEKALIDTNNPTASFALFPTYTRVCATQYRGDPNNKVSSDRLETVCSFGKLDPGSNSVTLTMLRGTWSLSSPISTSLGSLSEVLLSSPAYEPVFDGDPSSYDISNRPDEFPAQSINNWGSLYSAMFNLDRVYAQLNGGAAFTNFFNTNDSNLLIAGVQIDPNPATGNDKYFALAGLGGTFDSNTGVYSEKKDIIIYDNHYNNGQSNGYMNYQVKPYLINAETEFELLNSSNNNVTDQLVTPCLLSINSGSSINLCAITDADITAGDPLTNNYTHTLLAKWIVKGADICFDNDMYPGTDLNGNTICINDYTMPKYQCNTSGMTYNPMTWQCEMQASGSCPSGSWYDYSSGNCESAPICPPNTWYDEYRGVCGDTNMTYLGNIDCYEGTYNPTTGMCEVDLQTACYGQQQDPGESYDPNTQTCTYTDTEYLNINNFPTQVTLTGTGTLPASFGSTTQ